MVKNGRLLAFVVIMVLVSSCNNILSNNTKDILYDKIIEENLRTTNYTIDLIQSSQKANYPENWNTLVNGANEEGFQEVWCVIVETGPYRQGSFPKERYLPFIIARKGYSWKASNVLSNYYPEGPEKAFAKIGCNYDRQKWEVTW